MIYPSIEIESNIYTYTVKSHLSERNFEGALFLVTYPSECFYFALGGYKEISYMPMICHEN